MEEKYIYLNLPEQVGKNKHDIEELRTVKFNLERAGVRVVGEEASASDLPDPVTYTGQLGDAYLIGTEAPYQMYIYTQPSVGETNFKWFNIGAFPAQGPQGEEGPEGPRGPQGDASNLRFGTVNPSILDTDREHDGYLNTTTGMVFEFSGTNWIPIGSIMGPRGNQGVPGVQGAQGPQGQQGAQGPQGPAGITIEIIGVVETIGSLPDPSTVSRNAGYILESGDDKNLYIIVEDENQDLTWYDAGAFAGVPGTPAGFGTISATVTPITPGTAPSVTVSTSGTNDAKNIAFAFSLPVGAELENTAASTPSETKGYTQKVIDQKTMDFVIKKPSDLGFTDGELPASIFDVIQKITAQYTDTDIVIINESANENIKDAPSTIGQLFIRTGKGGMTPLAMWVDNVYNVHLFYGTDGNTPASPVWYRIMTTKDAAGIGTPAGGTTGQILAKKSDDDFDTKWEDVPNAPNGIPTGGSTGQMLVKNSGTNYDTKWATAPTGVPNGGTQDQILVKQSGNDGDVAWENPPVGLPSGGTQGQVLTKSSVTNFDVAWADPASGGGSGISFYGKNLIINPFFNINQRSATGSSSTAGYKADRWYLSTGTASFSTSHPYCSLNPSTTIRQAVEIGYGPVVGGKLFCGVTYKKTSNDPSPDSGAITLGLEKSDGTVVPFEKTRTRYKMVGSVNYFQHIGYVDLSDLEDNYNQVPYFWFKITAINVAGVTYEVENAFCYLVKDVTEDDFPEGVLLPVAPINYDVEVEKCRYYYIQYNDGPFPAIITTASITNGEIVSGTLTSTVLLPSMRLENPTITTTNLRFYILNSIGGNIFVNISTSNITKNTKKGVYTFTKEFSMDGSVFVDARLNRTPNIDAEIYPS